MTSKNVSHGYISRLEVVDHNSKNRIEDAKRAVDGLPQHERLAERQRLIVVGLCDRKAINDKCHRRIDKILRAFAQ